MLERKLQLQVNAAIRRSGRVRLPRERICLAKERRAQVADEVSVVDVIENVARIYAERQVVAVIRGTAASEHRAAATSAASASRRATRAAPKRSASAGTARAAARRGFFLLPEAKGLAQPQVQGKASRAGRIVDRNKSLAWRRKGVETAVDGLNDIRL